MIGIYRISNPKGNVYIGQSWSIESRWAVYKSLGCKDQPRIFNSLNKYGFDNHKFEVINELPKDITQNILDEYEVFYISAYKSAGIDLMNLTFGGSCGKHLEETKEKIRQANKGKPLSEERKIQVGKFMKGNKFSVGRVVSDATKEKMRQKKLGLYSGGKSYRSIKVININTLEEFGSIKEAAKSVNMNRSTLSWNLINVNKNKTQFRYKDATHF